MEPSSPALSSPTMSKLPAPNVGGKSFLLLSRLLLSSRLLRRNISSCFAFYSPAFSLPQVQSLFQVMSLHSSWVDSSNGSRFYKEVGKLSFSIPGTAVWSERGWGGTGQHVLEPFAHQLCCVIDQEGQLCLLNRLLFT